MSLVDYASSSDGDESDAPPEVDKNFTDDLIAVKRQRVGFPLPAAGSSPQVSGSDADAFSRNSPLSKQSGTVSNDTELKLPDASLLLNSPAVPLRVLNASNHASQVATAMAKSATRKRESNKLPASSPRSKVPKGFLPHSKNVPDTLGGRLLPPQLVGRSNVVTEDMGKLFSKRPTNLRTD